MKKIYLFISSLFILLFTGCASTKNSATNTKVHIIKATYHTWTKKLPNASLPENGIDIWLTVDKWPTNFKPEYLVFRNYKSISAVINEETDNNIEIHGRIIRASGVLAETSAKAAVLDRFVYTTANGDTAFIEIKNWQKIDD